MAALPGRQKFLCRPRNGGGEYWYYIQYLTACRLSASMIVDAHPPGLALMEGVPPETRL
jgi:hypothetical protein